MYGVGHEFLGWNPFKLSVMMTLALILTATWGSWATLVWTRSRFLRTLQQAMTIIPGLMLVLAGGALFYLGIGAWYLSFIMMFAGAGMSISSVGLSGGFMTQNKEPSKLQYLLGVGLFPLMSLALASIVTFVWLSFVPSPFLTSLKSFFSVGTMMTFIMASTLISTVIPALCSRACHELSCAWSINARKK